MIGRVAWICLALASFAPLCAAQATRPASLEQRSLLAGAATSSPKLQPPLPAAGGDLLSIRQLFVGLAIVLSLIFAVKWLLPHIWPAVTAQRNAAVRILGRTPVSPKNQIVLVQVGQRVLVLGENASQLTTLSSIDQPDEVALLLGKSSVRQDRDDAAPLFAASLDESKRAYQAEPSADELSDKSASFSGELSDLIGKVRGLARQIGRP